MPVQMIPVYVKIVAAKGDEISQMKKWKAAENGMCAMEQVSKRLGNSSTEGQTSWLDRSSTR